MLSNERGPTAAYWRKQRRAVREDRLWLALVAVPLAEVATGLLGVRWLWVPLLGAAYYWTPSARWLVVLSAELGVVGYIWAAVGVKVLTISDGPQRLFASALWVTFPLALAAVSWRNRRLH